MMKYTDTHCRYFHRLLSPSARLYTEMITAPAIIHGDRQRLLQFNSSEHPVALQLGGNCPVQLSEAAVIAEDLGYDEINLNCGCPSNRVQNGQFGACLMLTPEIVAKAISAMRNKVSVPITVKCRIGVDDSDSYETLHYFIQSIEAANCDMVIVHARKAFLKGLNPKQNRDIPPLNYSRVYQLKADFPHMPIVINGGIEHIQAINEHLSQVDGVMLGRWSYHHPRSLIEFEDALFDKTPDPININQLIILYQQYAEYAYKVLDTGNPYLSLMSVLKHAMNLFEGIKGSKRFRQTISGHAYKIKNRFDAEKLVLESLAHIAF